MKFLVDENIPQTIIRTLKQKLHTVYDIKIKQKRGSSDESLYQIAFDKRHIILTFDKDFLRKISPGKQASVVILHFPKMKPPDMLPWVDLFLEKIQKRKSKKPFQMVVSKQSVETITT